MDALEAVEEDIEEHGASRVAGYGRLIAMLPKYVSAKLVAVKGVAAKTAAMKGVGAKAATAKSAGSGAIMEASRPAAYASEVGESFRIVSSRKFVYTMYGMSILYVAADTALKTAEAREHGAACMAARAVDTGLWHVSASLVAPALVIHRVVDSTSALMKQEAVRAVLSPRVLVWTPITVGLCSIPFIIHPIDHFTDYVMDRTVRVALKDYLISNDEDLIG